MDWIKIFNSSLEMKQRLGDKPKLLTVRNKRICLALFQNDVRAVDDKCPHNGESLSKGTLNYLGEIVCPWHGYRFQLQTGRECAQRTHDLSTYPIKETAEGVFIGL